jgi:hypothetical protein
MSVVAAEVAHEQSGCLAQRRLVAVAEEQAPLRPRFVDGHGAKAHAVEIALRRGFGDDAYA